MASYQPDSNDPQPIPEISRKEILARLRDPSLVVLNVLPREAFVAAHIPGSLSLPVSEVGRRARELLPDSAQEIAVYCASVT